MAETNLEMGTLGQMMETLANMLRTGHVQARMISGEYADVDPAAREAAAAALIAAKDAIAGTCTQNVLGVRITTP